MIELAPRSASPIARFGGQPIAIAAAALVIVVLGIGSIALWRAYTGTAPETDRAVAIRQLQARTAQASEQLVEKTKGLEATQQELIDQLQVVQDQLQTVRRLLAAQQTDTKKLSEQVGTLTEAIEGCGSPLPAREPPKPPRLRAAQTVGQGKAPVVQKRATAAAPKRRLIGPISTCRSATPARMPGADRSARPGDGSISPPHATWLPPTFFHRL